MITKEEIARRKQIANAMNTLATIGDNLQKTGSGLFQSPEAKKEALDLTVQQTKQARSRSFGPDLSSVELFVARERQRRGCAFSSFKRFGSF